MSTTDTLKGGGGVNEATEFYMKNALKIHKQLGQFKEVARQRNDLLAACKAIEERFAKDCLLHETNPIVLKLRAAIARAERPSHE